MRGGPVLALLALLLAPGCVSPGPDLFPAQQETREAAASELFPGLSLRGTVQGAGPSLQMSAVARNDGPRTYNVETGCTTPWAEVVYQGETQLQHRRPVATCAAFAVRPFAPGETISYNASWTGLLYDEADGTFQRAPPGNYTWSLRLIAYAQDSNTVRRLDLDFDVTVQ